MSEIEDDCKIPGCPEAPAGEGRTVVQKGLCRWHLDLKYPHIAHEAGIEVVTDAERRAAKLTAREYALGDYEPCKDGPLKRKR